MPSSPASTAARASFTFTPQAGQEVLPQAQVARPASSSRRRTASRCPRSKADGVVLTALDAVTEKGDAIRVRLQVAEGRRSLHVGAYARGRLIGAPEASSWRPASRSKSRCKGDEAAGGVTRVTVFEEPQRRTASASTLIPRAERLVYPRGRASSSLLNVHAGQTPLLAGRQGAARHLRDQREGAADAGDTPRRRGEPERHRDGRQQDRPPDADALPPRGRGAATRPNWSTPTSC